MDDLKRTDPELKQPFLLARTVDGEPESVGTDDPPELFLVLDSHPMKLYNATFSTAIGLLFHSHWAFNVDYSARLAPIYGFLQKLYKLVPKRGFTRKHEVSIYLSQALEHENILGSFGLLFLNTKF